MEILLLLLAVIVIILLVRGAGGNNDAQYRDLRDRLSHLTRMVEQLQAQIRNQQEIKSDKPAQVYKPDDVSPDKQTTPKPPPAPAAAVTPKEHNEPLTDIKPMPHSVPLVTKPKPGWFSRHPDLEKFIGENLINKIGIGVLVLGISFFVKYAIDKDWIGEAGRVAIGLVAGAILIGIAHYVRNSYRSFSSVLVGGGLSVFYFTIAYAFHSYALIGQQAAFLIMVLITGFGVVLSLLYDRKELAIIATIGGFATPFMVSTGAGNYVALFTYIAILNTGLMTLAWFRKWREINIIALIFATLIVSGWMINRTFFHEAPFPYRNGFLFATLFYIQFMVMALLNNLRSGKPFAAPDFGIVIAINILYFTAGTVMLTFWDIGNVRGIFSGVLGAVNLGLAGLYSRKVSKDRSFVLLFTGLGISFLSLVGPLHFEGNAVALFWATESVLLIWLYSITGYGQLRTVSVLTLVLATVLSVANLTWQYSFNTTLPVLLNKGFITTLWTGVSILVYRHFLQREQEGTKPLNPALANLNVITLVTGIGFIFLAGACEIFFQVASFSGQPMAGVLLQQYIFAFAIVLSFLFRRSAASHNLQALLTIACFAIYFFTGLGNNPAKDIRPEWFIAYWPLPLLLLVMIYWLVRNIRRAESPYLASYRSSAWIISLAVVYIICRELYTAIAWLHYGNKDWMWWENLYFKAGISITWSVCSFALMWLGMKHRYQPLRIISLTLFTATLIKLFIYDIRNMPAGGKIAAFILLGVLLLTVSFMYQRLKKLLIDTKTENNGNADL